MGNTDVPELTSRPSSVFLSPIQDQVPDWSLYGPPSFRSPWRQQIGWHHVLLDPRFSHYNPYILWSALSWEKDLFIVIFFFLFFLPLYKFFSHQKKCLREAQGGILILDSINKLNWLDIDLSTFPERQLIVFHQVFFSWHHLFMRHIVCECGSTNLWKTAFICLKKSKY